MTTGGGIANRIKQIRENEGINQREFAEKIGAFSADHLRKIERGDVKEPKYEHLIAISNYSGVSTDHILKGSEFIMPRTPLNLNMNMHTIMAQEAIRHLGKAAKSIKELDVVATVGLEQLEKMNDKVIELDVDMELEKALKIVRLEGGIAN